MRTQIAVLCVLLLVPASSPTWSATKFELRELSMPPGAKGAFAVAINDRGDVVGSGEYTKRIFVVDVKVSHAVLWRNGKPIDLHPSKDSDDSHAVAINDKGDVLVNCDSRAYVWSKDKFRDLGSLASSQDMEGRVLNNRGEIVGVSSHNGQQPFVWTNGYLRLLRMPSGCDMVSIMGMNDRGIILGQATGEYTGYNVLWDNQKLKIINNMDSPHTIDFTGINNGGSRTGSLYVPDGDDIAVVWRNGKVTRLVPPKGRKGEYARAINDRGWVVGNAYSGSKAQAVVWLRKEVVDLGIPGRTTYASDINNAGTVVGSFGDTKGILHPAKWSIRNKRSSGPATR
jgi:uncharacterized membrane protein